MSDIKCPICGSKMSVSYGSGEGLFSCSNLLCKAGGFYATDEMWQELIRTRKALDVAVKELKASDRYYQDDEHIKEALDQIKQITETK